jgi:hypothetical protein
MAQLYSREAMVGMAPHHQFQAVLFPTLEVGAVEPVGAVPLARVESVEVGMEPSAPVLWQSLVMRTRAVVEVGQLQASQVVGVLVAQALLLFDTLTLTKRPRQPLGHLL